MKHIAQIIIFAVAAGIGFYFYETKPKKMNQVIVIGTIHDQHRNAPSYSLKVLKDIISNLNPDIVITEIPPASFEEAKKQFDETGKITEFRTSQFPEYTDVVFPLYKKMGFEIVPASAWTYQMAVDREEKLDEISTNPNRRDEWRAYVEASHRSRNLMNEAEDRFDPVWIHSDKYDDIVNIDRDVFNQFNDELGLGGWDNINAAHYSLISKELDRVSGQDKKVVITFGAGHKGWFKKALSKRNDIELINLIDAL